MIVRYKLTEAGSKHFDLLGEAASKTEAGKAFREAMTETDWQLEQLLTLTQDCSMSKEEYLQCLETSKREGRPQIHIDMMSNIDLLIALALEEKLLEISIEKDD